MVGILIPLHDASSMNSFSIIKILSVKKFPVLGTMHKAAHSMYPVHQAGTNGCNLGDGELQCRHRDRDNI